MAEPTLAQTLLLAAERDQQAFRKLADDPTLHDSLAGFHAQQAVEKALKAVLAHAGVAFRRTHDIAELLDHLEDLDRLEDGRWGVFYTRQKPLNLAAFERKRGPGI